MVLNQMALLYGNHFDEARRVVDWLGCALPRAERYAKEGLTLHKVSVKYSGGAKFGPLMGYDGTIVTPPTEAEGSWAHEDFAGNNAALMALNWYQILANDDPLVAAKGGILVSGEFQSKQVRVTLDNRSDRDCERHLHVRLPKGTTSPRLREKGLRVEEGWAVLPAVQLPPKAKRAFTLGAGAVLRIFAEGALR